MSAAARAAAQAVGYVGAGTVEFIVDDAGFYFIEMNTRLQVEHPVTEMITGLDLVEWQLRVAFGEVAAAAAGRDRSRTVTRSRPASTPRMPDKGFLPATGTIAQWREPAGDGIRVDTGFRAGDAVTPYYDALLAKLIACAAPTARRRSTGMVDALGEFEIAGVTTNLAFLEVADEPSAGGARRDRYRLHRAGNRRADAGRGHRLAPLDLAAACVAVLVREQREQVPPSVPSPWDRTDGWTIAGRRSRRLSFRYGAQRYDARALVWARRTDHGIRRQRCPAAIRRARRRPARPVPGRCAGAGLGRLVRPRRRV